MSAIKQITTETTAKIFPRIFTIYTPTCTSLTRAHRGKEISFHTQALGPYSNNPKDAYNTLADGQFQRWPLTIEQHFPFGAAGGSYTVPLGANSPFKALLSVVGEDLRFSGALHVISIGALSSPEDVCSRRDSPFTALPYQDIGEAKAQIISIPNATLATHVHTYQTQQTTTAAISSDPPPNKITKNWSYILATQSRKWATIVCCLAALNSITIICCLAVCCSIATLSSFAILAALIVLSATYCISVHYTTIIMPLRKQKLQLHLSTLLARATLDTLLVHLLMIPLYQPYLATMILIAHMIIQAKREPWNPLRLTPLTALLEECIVCSLAALSAIFLATLRNSTTLIKGVLTLTILNLTLTNEALRMTDNLITILFVAFVTLFSTLLILTALSLRHKGKKKKHQIIPQTYTCKGSTAQEGKTKMMTYPFDPSPKYFKARGRPRKITYRVRIFELKTNHTQGPTLWYITPIPNPSTDPQNRKLGGGPLKKIIKKRAPAHTPIHNNLPYHERQIQNHCQVHALNMAMGYPLLNGGDLTRFCQEQILARTQAGRHRAAQAWKAHFDSTGNFTTPIVNRWLLTHLQGPLCIAPIHQIFPEHMDSNPVENQAQLQNLIHFLQNSPETVIVLQGNRHASCIKKHEGNWYHLDSLNNGPTLLNHPNIWLQRLQRQAILVVANTDPFPLKIMSDDLDDTDLQRAAHHPAAVLYSPDKAIANAPSRCHTETDKNREGKTTKKGNSWDAGLETTETTANAAPTPMHCDAPGHSTKKSSTEEQSATVDRLPVVEPTTHANIEADMDMDTQSPSVDSLAKRKQPEDDPTVNQPSKARPPPGKTEQNEPIPGKRTNPPRETAKKARQMILNQREANKRLDIELANSTGSPSPKQPKQSHPKPPQKSTEPKNPLPLTRTTLPHRENSTQSPEKGPPPKKTKQLLLTTFMAMTKGGAATTKPVQTPHTTEPDPITPPTSAQQEPQTAPTKNPSRPSSMMIMTLNCRGLTSNSQTVSTHITESNPDVVILTETKLIPGKPRTWLKQTLKEYLFITSNASNPKDDPQNPQQYGRAGVIIAVKKKHHNQTQLLPVETRTDTGLPKENKALAGYLAHILLNDQYGAKVHVLGVYAPEDTNIRKQIYAYIKKVATQCRANNEKLLASGDWNATASPTDRNDHTQDTADLAHQAFLNESQLSPLFNPTSMPAQGRPYTYHRMEEGKCTHSSRIDDTITLSETAHDLNKTQQIREITSTTGGTLDHSALHTMAPAGTFLPPRPQHEDPSAEKDPPKKKLILPISKENWEGVRDRIDEALKQENSPGTTLKASTLLLKDFVLGLLDNDYTYPNILKVRGNPAFQQVISHLAEHTKTIQQCLNTTYDIMLESLPTKPPFNGKLYMRRKLKKEQNDLYQKQKAMKLALRIAGEQNLMGTIQDTPRLLETISPALYYILMKEQLLPDMEEDMTELEWQNWQDRLTETHKSTSNSLKRLNKKHDTESGNKIRANFRHLLATRPKVAHRTIYKNKNADQEAEPLSAIKDVDTNQVHRTPTGIIHALYNYAKKLASPAFGRKTGKYLPKEVDRRYPWAKKGAKDQFTLEGPANQHRGKTEMLRLIMDKMSFKDTISHLPGGKAPGPDGIPNEVIKLLPEHITSAILDVFTVMWISGITPDNWKDSNTVLLYKAKDPTEPSNYRPVGLANTLYKLWTCTITKALTSYAEQHNILSSSQEGFRVRKSTQRQIMNMTQIIEDAALTGRNLYTCYIDFSCAFNTTDHDKTLQIMYDLGFPEDAIDVIRDLYTNVITRISTHQYGNTPDIQVDRGTIQGDNLSPFLFLCFIEPMLRWLQVGGKGYRYGNLTTEENDQYSSSAPAYADDTAITTNTLPNLRDQLHKVTEFSNWGGLVVNAGKSAVTGILHQDYARGIVNNPADVARLRNQLEGKITLQGKPVPFLSPNDPYKYLGILLTMTLEWAHQVSACAKTIMNRSKTIGLSMASKAQKLRLIEITLRPAITYTMATTAYSAADINILDGFYSRAVRACIGMSPSAPTASIFLTKEHQGLGVTSLWNDYVSSSAKNLVMCLNDKGRLGTVTRAHLKLQDKRTGDLILNLNPKHSRFSTILRQMAMCSRDDITVMDQGKVLGIQKNEIWPILKQVRNAQNPHQAQNPFMTRRLKADVLAPLAQIGITSLAHITSANGTHIMSTRDLANMYGNAVEDAHKISLNRITLLITEKHDDGDDPLKYIKTTPLEAKQRVLPTQWRQTGSLAHPKTVKDLWETLPQYAPPGSPQSDLNPPEEPPPQKRKTSRAACLRRQCLEGRREDTTCYADTQTDSFKALLATGDPQAVLAYYSEQDTASAILSHRQQAPLTERRLKRQKPTSTLPKKRGSDRIILDRHTQYEVQWSDTCMKTTEAETHLKCYAKLGYHPERTNPEGAEGAIIRVVWKPTYENEELLRKLPNWETLKEEYQTHLETQGNPTPKPAPDVHLTNMQQQGIWTKVTQDHTSTTHKLRDYIHLTDTPCNPDLDVEPQGYYTMQEGLHPAGGSPTNQDQTYLYDPMGRYLGHLPNFLTNRLMETLTAKRGYSFHKASALIASLIKRYPYPQTKPTTARQYEKLSRMPTEFIKALKLIGISHEHCTHPLQVDPYLRSHSSLQKEDIALGATNTSYGQAWDGAALVQCPPNQDAMHKSMRWAIASSTKDSPSFTLFAMPDATSEQHQKYNRHENYYNLGTLLMRKVSHPQYWNGKNNTSESTLATKHQYRVRLILIANDQAMQENLSDASWNDFIKALGKMGDPDGLYRPNKNSESGTTFKLPKAFKDLALPTVHPSPKDEDDSKKRTREEDPTWRPKPAPLAQSDTLEIYTDGSCIKGQPGYPNQVGAAFVIKEGNNSVTFLVNPRGQGATNTINRAELSAIHMALVKILEQAQGKDITIYTDSRCAIQLINKAVYHATHIHLNKHKDMLQKINTIMVQRASDRLHTSICKVKSHIGIEGNEQADQGANRAAKVTPNQTDTWMEETANPEPFGDVTWLSTTKTDAQGAKSLWPLNNLTSALKEYLLPKWQAGKLKEGQEEGQYVRFNRAVHPYISQKHSTGFWSRSKFGASMLNLKLLWGTVWNKKQAYKRKGKMQAKTPQCPLCTREDGCTHIYGGCLHPEMQAHYIARHNAAVLKIYEATQKGDMHNCYAIVDATARDALPLGVESNRIPEWILPKLLEADRKKLRPDILIIEGLDRGMADTFKGLTGSNRKTAMRDYTIHILEVGYTSHTRYLDKMQEKSDQHEKLVADLREEGWKVQYTDQHRIVLGTPGTIYLNTVDLLSNLFKIPMAKVDSTLCKLSALAVNKGQDIICARRRLENTQLPSTLHPHNRRYNNYRHT